MASKAAGVLIVIGIIAAALYARRAHAAYSDDTGQTSWLPVLSLPDLSWPDFSFDTWTSALDNQSVIAIDDYPEGETVYWKVNEYPKYASAIREVERRYGIPQDLLGRILYQESRFRTDVIAGTNRSPVGALGIAQFMPDTAREMGVNPLDPFDAIDGAGRYLKKMHGLFGNWREAMMAYNWGPGNVRKWLQAGKGYPAPMETSTYIAQVTADVPVV